MINEMVARDNLALIERNRELERELAGCKAKLGRVLRIAEELHGDAVSELDAWGDMPLPARAARDVAEKCRLSNRIIEEIGR